MDDLAHQCPRKRKQDQDDCQDPTAPDTQAVVADRDRDLAGVPCNPPNTPRRPWITEADDNWTSPTSPQVSSPLTLNAKASSSSKRPRLDALDTSAAKRHHQPRRSGNKILPSPLTAMRQGSDIEDIGIVSTADPGPSSGSLLRDRQYESYTPQNHTDVDVVRIHVAIDSPILDFTSPNIPAMKPLINRATLKELELDVILRNPVIRHDLLFDPGLQFRPRRKREKFEKYWNAVWEEVQTGCTCITMDTHGNLHQPKMCICSRTTIPSPGYNMAEEYMSDDGELIYSLRLPSRIPALLTEFLEVMVFVIQPLSNTAVYTDPNAIREQAQEHSAHAAYLRSIFDPVLISQELKHKVFDPSGLFVRIGQTLKHHCAPMRDRAVEEMVQMAQRPGPEAFKAVRTCLELLELMKLDIANHQLTQLRPWLLRNTGIFEVKAFKIRFGNNPSLHHTRRWLDDAHNALLDRKTPILHPSYPMGCLRYTELRRNHQIYLSALKGVVDLIFDIQETHPLASLSGSISSSTNSSSHFTCSPLSPVSPINASRLASNLIPLPETLYLDKSRLLHLSTEAVSTTALYMFMLLFRQLVFSEQSTPSSVVVIKVDQNDMTRVKREIRDIGPPCLGTCFEDSIENVSSSPPTPVQESGSSSSNGSGSKKEKDQEHIRNSKQGLVLQIAKRASEIRRTNAFSTSESETRPGDAPDPALLSVAQRWVDGNMKPGSALTGLLHKRMRDAVFDAVVCVAYPGRDATQAAVSAGRSLGVDWAASGILAGMHLSGGASKTSLQVPVPQTAGMEFMADEIRRLAEDIARLALIHLNTHLPLYESQGFFSDRAV